VNDKEYIYTIPSTGEKSIVRVARSGFFGNRQPSGLESAHRHGGKPNEGKYYIGFRLVKEVTK